MTSLFLESFWDLFFAQEILNHLPKVRRLFGCVFISTGSYMFSPDKLQQLVLYFEDAMSTIDELDIVLKWKESTVTLPGMTSEY